MESFSYSESNIVRVTAVSSMLHIKLTKKNEKFEDDFRIHKNCIHFDSQKKSIKFYDDNKQHGFEVTTTSFNILGWSVVPIKIQLYNLLVKSLSNFI